MKNELRTAVSLFVAELGTDLDYILANRRDGSKPTVRQLVDALADGEGRSATDIVNELGVSANPLTELVVQMAKDMGASLRGRGRGPTDDPVKAKIGKLTASSLIDAKRAAIAKARAVQAKAEADAAASLQS